MRKLYALKFVLGVFFILMTNYSQSQSFNGTYNFASVTTSTGTTDPSPVPNATGLNWGSFSAIGQISGNSNAAGRFSFTNQTTGATDGNNVFTGNINTTRYYQVTITPQFGYTIDLNSIKFTLQRSGTGIRQYSVRSSLDYTTNLVASIAPSNTNLSVVATNIFQVSDATTNPEAGSTITLGSVYDVITNPVTFRFYGWNAEAATGSFSIDDVILSGTATQTVFYVNDNSTSGDHYTTAIGNDANPGTSALPFATIQHAIDAASSGNTIIVDAGTFSGNFIVNKNLTFQGSAFGVDGNSSRPAESILNAPTSGSNRLITLSGSAITTTFDGFKVVGKNVVTMTDGTQNLTIKNSVAELDFSDADNNIYSSGASLTLDHNLFKAINGVNPSGASSHILSGSANLFITNNKFTSEDAINDLTGGTTSLPVWINITTSSQHAQVTGNEFNKIDIGVLIADNASDVLISGNDFIEAKRDTYVHGGSYGTGIALFGDLTPSSLISITNNNFVNSETGIRTSTGSATNTLPATSLLGVHQNSFSNISVKAIRIGSGYSGTLDATCNWWGTIASGAIAAMVTPQVNYSPYLLDGTDNQPIVRGFQTSATCTTASTLYVNDGSNVGDHYTTGLGNDANPGTSALPFATIQHAISVAVSGNTIMVDAGTYREDIIVDKTLSIRGSNYNVNPNTGTRVGESIIQPFTSDPDPNSATAEVIMYLNSAASGSAIDGFTFDGDNPTKTSTVNFTNGANVDAVEAISGYDGLSSVTVSNNIIKSLNYAGIDFYNYTNGGAATTGNSITNNKFDNILPSIPYGEGILIYNNCYTSILNNVMTGVRIGVQTGNFFNADPGLSHTISNNNIESQRVGIFHNLAYSDASSFTISNNNITTYTGSTTNEGLEISSIGASVAVNISNNNVTGANYGIDLWSNPTINTVTVSGGTLTNCNVGVFANNYDGYSSNASSSAYIISGINIQNATTTGIYVKDNNSNTNNATVSLQISGSTIINNTSTGLKIEGADASATFSGPTPAAFTGQSTYIDMVTNGTNVPVSNINATTVTFGGTLGSAMTLSQLFSTEDKINHKIDNPALGFVTVKANNDYVTTNSFISPATTSAKVQRGVDAASAGWTVNVANGTYINNVIVNKSITVAGQSQASTIVKPEVSNPNCGGGGGGSLCSGGSNVFLIQANDVTIQNVTIDGDNPALTSSIIKDGADIDARNGIITDHTLGTYNNLVVNNSTIKNIYLRGIYASSGGTFTFSNNTVINVQADQASVGIFNFGGSGTFTNNTVTKANDAIASNHSRGCTYSGNTITLSGSGIHTDNCGDGGGTGDIIQNNTVTNSTTDGYGIWVFAPYLSVTVQDNTVTNVDVGLANAGQGAPVTTIFRRNTIDGQGKVNSAGVYQTTQIFGYSNSNVSGNYINNYIVNNDDGFFLEYTGGFANNIIANDNSITGNTPGVTLYTTTPKTGTDNFTCNWWGSNDPAAVATAVGGSVNYLPYRFDGNDTDPVTPGFQPANNTCYNPTLLTDYFRSKQTGNWNVAATWESSTDNTNWHQATLSPNYHSNNITIQSGHIVTVAVNDTTDQTIVNSGGTITVNSGIKLYINDGTGWDIVVNGTVNGAGNMTVRSTSAGTASVGNSSGSITLSTTVDRYIPDDGHRAWRLLSVPATGQTIRQAWQENGSAINNLGVLITSHDYTDGFDAPPSISSSILMHDQGGISGPSWLTRPVTSTNVPIASEQGYMLFVRSDRNATAANSLHDYTVLRTTGTLKQGTQPAVTISSTGAGYTLTGNPYASAIDFEQIQSTPNIDQQFYIWDANLSGAFGVGGFRLIERNGGTYRQTPQPMGGSGTAVPDPNSRYINSGQAFFLHATGADASVVFTEAVKTNQLPSINPFSPTSVQQQIIANLYVVNAGNALSLADGVRISYDNSYLPGSSDDINKINNFSENLALIREGKSLIVEKRPMITGRDTLFLRITNTGIKNYQFQIGALDFVQSNVAGYLKDNFLNTTTQLNLNGTTTVNFSITSDPHSSAADRFKIVFSPAGVLPITLNNVKAYQQNANIAVEWKVDNETAMQKYEVEKSADGNSFISVASKNATGNNLSSVNYSWLDVNAIQGNNFYRIKSVGISGRVEYSSIVKVYIGKGKPSITVYPNPVTDGIIHLQMNNMAKGTYILKVVNAIGQIIITKAIDHVEGSSNETINMGKNFAKGNYQLQLINPDGSQSSISIIN